MNIKKLMLTCAFAFGALAMVSCGDKTSTPSTENSTPSVENSTPSVENSTPSTDTEHVHNPASEWSKDATKHWHECDGCEEKLDKEAHAWGEWIEDEAATETSKGSHHRICSICDYRADEEIPMLPPEFGVATELTAVYVKAPIDWDSVNIYYWGDAIEETLKVGWPGKAMTLVNADENLWGYKIPAGTEHVIFNTNGIQTADLDFAPAKNLYVLDTVNAEGKYTAYFDNYTATADDPELGQTQPTVVERITIYAQVPAEWEEVYVHFWGCAEASDWPGHAMTVVDEENHIYSFDIQETATGIIFNAGNEKPQTGNIEDFVLDVDGLNGFIVADDLSVTRAHYADGVFTPLGGDDDNEVEPIVIDMAATGFRDVLSENQVYLASETEFVVGDVTFSANTGVGQATNGYNPGFYSYDAIQMKKAEGVIVNKDAIVGAKKVTINWIATYDKEGTQYFPVVKEGAAADALNVATCDQTAELAGVATGVMNGNFEVHTYTTTYTLSEGSSFFSFGASSSAVSYITSIVIEF